jgi:alpha-1,3-rhamnosyl/mannosyltransferase
LYVGNHRPHKNLSLLLQGWSDLQDSRRNGCWLVIAGAINEPYAEAVRRSREPCRDRVSFLGPVAEADLPSVYRGARILVHPALQEGFGLPIIEAMACGVPVACSRAPALDGTCGAAALRFDAESSIDTARAIDLLLHDDALRETLVVAGLQRAGELTWTRTAELTLSAYRKALSRAGTEALAP